MISITPLNSVANLDTNSSNDFSQWKASVHWFYWLWTFIISIITLGQKSSTLEQKEKSLQKIESQCSALTVLPTCTPSISSSSSASLITLPSTSVSSPITSIFSIPLPKFLWWSSGPVSNRKQLVLDLDETLISSSSKHSFKHDISVKVYIGGIPSTFFVRKRPNVDTFLEKVSEWFELIVFTASLSPYANAVIDKLDPKRRITRRFYRQSCTNKGGSYVKDLQIVCKDLSKVVIIDNSPAAYSGNKENAIPIDDWFGNNSQDTALLDLLPLLEQLKDSSDVRDCLKTNQVLKNGKSKSPLKLSSNC